MKTHIGHSLSRCNEKRIEVLSLHSGVVSDQLRPRLTRKAQTSTAVPDRAGTYTSSYILIQHYAELILWTKTWLDDKTAAADLQVHCIQWINHTNFIRT